MGRVDVWGGDLLSALVRHFLLDLTKMKKQHRGFGPEKWNIHPTLHDFEKIKTYWLIGCEGSGEKWSVRSGLDQECSLGRVIATKQTEGVCGRRVFWGSLRDWGNSVLSTSPILTSLIIPRTLPGTHCYSNFISFFLKSYCFIIFMCMRVFVCVFVYYMHPVPTEAGRGLWISWNWSYSWLWASVWMLRIDPRSSVHAFNCGAISPAPLLQF